MKAAWSRLVPLRQLSREPVDLQLEADGPTRGRIARSLELVAVDALEAEVQVRPWLDGAEIYGRWAARVVQTCSLSADDFETRLEGAFTVRCAPAGSPLATPTEDDVEIDLDAEDPPDVLEDDQIDVAAYVVEHLALELDPFPRKPGAVFEPPAAAPEPGPFDVLSRLKPAGGEGSAGG